VGQARVLADLGQLGLVLFQPARGRVFATRMFIESLGPRIGDTAGSTLLSLSSSSAVRAKGGIITEKNFRVYAYTSSRTVISLVRLFADQMQRLPGLFVAMITRDSVLRAFRNGISADQIVEFLRKNAHPAVMSSPLLVPDTVAEQLQLWERERTRLQFESAVLLGSFASRAAFESTKQKSLQIGAHLWSNDRLQRIVVRETLYEDLQQALRHS
jgi:transcription initiation factor TFIIH subunit 4